MICSTSLESPRKLQLKKETLSLLPVIDAAVERSVQHWRQESAWIGPAARSIVLEADHLRLTQVISNLLLNAVKYSDPGSHILSSVCCKGHIDAVVKDTGIGSRLSHGRLFDMFSQ